jgi:hypothetical protein
MHYQEGGGKYPILIQGEFMFPGEFCIKGRNIGRNSFVQGELAFLHLGALFHQNFSCAPLLMVSNPFDSP